MNTGSHSCTPRDGRRKKEWNGRTEKEKIKRRKKINDSRPPRRSLKNSLKGNKGPASTVMIFFVRRKGKGTFFFFLGGELR